jgi:hypothetical protein
VAADT